MTTAESTSVPRLKRGSLEPGQRFARWTVVQKAERIGSRLYHLCRCDCGTERLVREYFLRVGHSQSCGCLNRDVITKHGAHESPEYYVWRAIKARCRNPGHAAYPRYGGRGVGICDEWFNDFSAFIAHVGRRPSNQYSIERIDNNKGYEPGNVCWATIKEQCVNKRNVKLYEFNGRALCIAHWANEIGMSETTLGDRLRQGCSIEEALTRPVINPAIRRRA